MPKLTFGDIDDLTKPLAILVHGFPDTPHTWRYLGPALVGAGYRVSAPWLPGYRDAADGPLSAGTYVRRILAEREARHADERAVLIGHDWGANAGYGVVSTNPAAFTRYVALAVPPTAALANGLFSYGQLKRSFYIWFIQQVGLSESVLLGPGFWESLWSDWSPGYDAAEDLTMLRRHVSAENIAGVLSPYRASFDTRFADPDTLDESAATLAAPPVPTLYLHGSRDGAIGADLLGNVAEHLPAAGSAFRIVDAVGHFLHLERPDEIASLILAWLAEG